MEAADRERSGFGADMAFHEFDLETFPWPVDRGFALVTAIEVIEHMRDPIGFLSGIRELLDEDGLAVITTPYMESLASRLRFLASGKLRQMDAAGDPTHVSPIFIDLLRRRYLPAAELRLDRHLLYPPVGHLAVRPWLQPPFRVISRFLPHELTGDTSVFFLRQDRAP